MVQTPPKKPLILVVEDDPHGLHFMESSLALSGFAVRSAASAEEARALCAHAGLSDFSAVLCDYRLPGETGIDLLHWIRQQDPTLATLLITGQGEKAIVQQALSVGAFDYLEKPVTHQFLREVLWRAVAHTRRQRQSALDRRHLEQLEQLDLSMSKALSAELAGRMRIYYRPLHEVGGDFLITHDYGGGRWLVLAGDVAGHDIRSGYVSTYFQGMFRGCIESGADIEAALSLFNRALLQGRANLPANERISLSISALEIDLPTRYFRHWNCGFPPCRIVHADGRISELPFGHFPLGWMDTIEAEPLTVHVAGKAFLYLHTDGLLEFAEKLQMSPFSLLYRLLRDTNAIRDLPLGPSDDILACCIHLTPEIPLSASFEPILSEHYAGSEVEHIDQLQAVWRRNLSYALGDRLGDRLYDLLICIREGMLNALIHGCEKAADKFAHLQISVNSDKSVLRVIIDDPGRGHSFDLNQRMRQISAASGRHLGLGIIQHLSDQFEIENKGTSLVFDFEISPANV